jgi:hypothetical protein
MDLHLEAKLDDLRRNVSYAPNLEDVPRLLDKILEESEG